MKVRTNKRQGGTLLDSGELQAKVAKKAPPPPSSSALSKKGANYEVQALSPKVAKRLLESMGVELPPAPEAAPVSTQRRRRQRKVSEAHKGSAFAPRAVNAETMSADAEASGWRNFPLDAQLQAGLAAMGLTTPTYIQSQVLPRALQGRCDILGAAPTGSGKTLAYGIPLVQRVLTLRAAAGGVPRVRGLIIAPTRELAMQVTAHLRGLVQCCEPMVRIATIVGGMAVQKQTDRLLRKPDVVIATPGRLAEFLDDRRADGPQGDAARYVADLAGLAAIALDEADRMVEDGHFKELRKICALLPELASMRTKAQPTAGKKKRPSGSHKPLPFDDEDVTEAPATAELARQTFVLSATLTGARSMEKVLTLLKPQGKLTLVDASSRHVTPEGLRELEVRVLPEDKDAFLIALLVRSMGTATVDKGEVPRILVFANAMFAVRRIARLLRCAGFARAHALHGQMVQKERLRTLDRFAAADADYDHDKLLAQGPSILVATDVAARGLDLPSVSTVIHYELPASTDVYVHRAGRTARGAGAVGESIVLVSPKEAREVVHIARLGSTGSDGDEAGKAPTSRLTPLNLMADPVSAAMLSDARRRARDAQAAEYNEYQAVKKARASTSSFVRKLTGSTLEELGFSDDEGEETDAKGRVKNKAAAARADAANSDAPQAAPGTGRGGGRRAGSAPPPPPPPVPLTAVGAGMVTITPELLASVRAAGGIERITSAGHAKRPIRLDSHAPALTPAVRHLRDGVRGAKKRQAAKRQRRRRR